MVETHGWKLLFKEHKEHQTSSQPITHELWPLSKSFGLRKSPLSGYSIQNRAVAIMFVQQFYAFNHTNSIIVDPDVLP